MASTRCASWPCSRLCCWRCGSSFRGKRRSCTRGQEESECNFFEPGGLSHVPRIPLPKCASDYFFKSDACRCTRAAKRRRHKIMNLGATPGTLTFLNETQLLNVRRSLRKEGSLTQ